MKTVEAPFTFDEVIMLQKWQDEEELLRACLSKVTEGYSKRYAEALEKAEVDIGLVLSFENRALQPDFKRLLSIVSTKNNMLLDTVLSLLLELKKAGFY